MNCDLYTDYRHNDVETASDPAREVKSLRANLKSHRGGYRFGLKALLFLCVVVALVSVALRPKAELSIDYTGRYIVPLNKWNDLDKGRTLDSWLMSQRFKKTSTPKISNQLIELPTNVLEENWYRNLDYYGDTMAYVLVRRRNDGMYVQGIVVSETYFSKHDKRIEQEALSRLEELLGEWWGNLR